METFGVSENLIVLDYFGAIEGVVLANYFNTVNRNQKLKIIEGCGKFFRLEYTVIIFLLMGVIFDTRLLISKLNVGFFREKSLV